MSKHLTKCVLQHRSRSFQPFTSEDHKLGWSEGMEEHSGHTEGIPIKFARRIASNTILQGENTYGGTIDMKRFRKENEFITFAPFSRYFTAFIRGKIIASNLTPGQDAFDLSSLLQFFTLEMYIKHKKQRHSNKEA